MWRIPIMSHYRRKGQEVMSGEDKGLNNNEIISIKKAAA